MEKKEHPLNDLMGSTMERLRSMVDVNTVVGEPILAGEVTIIPVSMVSVGFASGGSDFASKNQRRQRCRAKDYSHRISYCSRRECKTFAGHAASGRCH